MSNTWTQQSERGSAFAIQLMISIGLGLGRPIARLLLWPISLYFLLTAQDQRDASRRYLRRVLPHPVRWWHIFRHIHTFSCTILDRLYLLSDQSHRLSVKLHGVELLEAQVATGQGALLLGSHLGSFEVLRALAVLDLKLPLRILMYRGHNAVIMKAFDALNPELARTVIELGKADSMIRVGEALAQGHLVGILGDRVADSRKSTVCQLLDGPVTLPTAPVLLAHHLTVPILLFFGLYRGSNRYDVYFELLTPRVVLEDGQRPQQMHAVMQKFADRLQAHMQDAPYNWFNFYDFWNERAA